MDITYDGMLYDTENASRRISRKEKHNNELPNWQTLVGFRVQMLEIQVAQISGRLVQDQQVICMNI